LLENQAPVNAHTARKTQLSLENQGHAIALRDSALWQHSLQRAALLTMELYGSLTGSKTEAFPEKIDEANSAFSEATCLFMSS
jgi:hypothetical protein